MCLYSIFSEKRAKVKVQWVECLLGMNRALGSIYCTTKRKKGRKERQSS